MTQPIDKRTHQARRAAHAAFDLLWTRLIHFEDPTRKVGGNKRKRHKIGVKMTRRARTRAYRWLADQMGVEEIHIGQLDAEGCQRVIEICKGQTARGVRDWARAEKKRGRDEANTETTKANDQEV